MVSLFDVSLNLLLCLSWKLLSMDTGQPGMLGPVAVCPVVEELNHDPGPAVIQLRLMVGLIVLEWTLNLDFAIQKFALNVTKMII